MNRFNILIFFLFPLVLCGQDILLPLQHNPVIIQSIKKGQMPVSVKNSSSIILPVLDDFSKTGIYPDTAVWEDADVFINNAMGRNAPTVGYATFDAVDAYGDLHPDASIAPFISDYLSSRSIRLDSVFGSSNYPISPADSVYLSFFIQPQGLGNAPEPGDSLVLDFFAPGMFNWTRVWSMEGMTYNDFIQTNQTAWLRVMIPITDSVYFKDGFQFRFRNYASVAKPVQPGWASNADFWHLDYVYLNILRHANDTLIDDVAHTKQPAGLLKNYSSAPWKHFKGLGNPAAEIVSSTDYPYYNFSDVTKTVKRSFEIRDLNGNPANDFFYPSSGTSFENCDPAVLNIFSIPMTYTFGSNAADSASFLVVNSINTTPDINRNNDTSAYLMHFSNYYAYDDGIPDAGYGINIKNGKVAMEFNTWQTDTLRAIQLFFNRVLNDLNDQFFHLTVWKSLDPEEIIYQHKNYKPLFEDSLNEFYTYRIDDTLLVLSGTYYIGWQQSHEIMMNIGFDMNNDLSSKIKYNISGSWVNTLHQGALMMRPVFGSVIPYGVGISEDNNIIETAALYPNPAKGQFHVKADNVEQIFIFNTSGVLIRQQSYSNSITTEGMESGIYLVRLLFADGRQTNHRLVVLH